MEAGVLGQSHQLLSDPHCHHKQLLAPPAAPPTALQRTHSLDSSAFGLVVDARTDFQVTKSSSGDGSHTPSPQQSYRLTPRPPEPPSEGILSPTQTPESTPHSSTTSLPPSPSLHPRRLLYGFIDTHLGASDGSLVSGGIGRGGSGGGGGHGRNSLAVAGVHRFGSRLPCAGSPHDLASCPAPPPPQNQKRKQQGDSTKREETEKELQGPDSVASSSDALKTLSETSTALSLTETLIGPLRLPHIPPAVLKEVLIGMEHRPATRTPPPASGTHREGWGRVGQEENGVFPHLTNPRNTGLVNGGGKEAASETGSGMNTKRIMLHEGRVGTGAGGECRVVSVSGPGGGEEVRELYRYPPAAITTVVERRSYLGLQQVGPEEPRPRRRRPRPRRRTASQNSLASDSSACASGSSMASLLGHSATPSKASSRGSGSSDAPGPPQPLLSLAVQRARRTLEGGERQGLAVSPCPSDTSSSNLSTLSDLSGYQEEYLTLRRLVSDATSPEDHHHHLVRLAAAAVATPPRQLGPWPEEVQREMQEAAAHREDLEIQVHRLSVQVHNAVREKEVLQQQLELVQTQVAETGQRQCFEAQRQRAALEGRLETIQQELEAAVQQRTQMQGRLSAALAEAREAQAAAAQAAESQAMAMARLEKFEIANRGLEVDVKEATEGLAHAKNELGKARQQAGDLQAKCEAQVLALEQVREAAASLRQEAQEVRSRLAHVEAQQGAMGKAKGQAEAAAAKATAEAKAAAVEAARHQEQLRQAEEARAALRREVLEARSALARMETEKEEVEARVESLAIEVEEGRARAVREKSLLVSHLEALQADMAEREALLARLQEDHTAGSRLARERQQRLEEDRQRMQRLRLDLAEAERKLADAKEDLHQRGALLSHREAQLKEAKAAAAVGQEELREREGRIIALEQCVQEQGHTASALREERTVGQAMVATLQEENSRLVAALEAATQEKAEVDAAILKVREDMSRLTTSVYRMRHDLAAKDRRIDQMATEAKEAAQIKAALEERLAALRDEAHHEEEKAELRGQVEGLKEKLRAAGEARAGLEAELAGTRASIKTIEAEKRTLVETCNLQEEQIHSLEGGAESCREVVLRKEEELHRAREQHAGLEEEYVALRKNWETLKGENLSLRQEAEACAEHEAAQRREQSDLKDSIQKERKLKQSLERKVEAQAKEHEAAHEAAEKVRLNLLEHLEQAQEEAKNSREEFLRRCSQMEEDLMTAMKEKEGLKIALQDLKKELEVSQTNLEGQVLATKTLEVRVEALEGEKSLLEEAMKTRIGELSQLEERHKEQQAAAVRLADEKERLTTQMRAILTENTLLKRMQKATDSLASETVNNNNNNINNNISAVQNMVPKSSEILQKEVSTLKVRLEEAGRQREAIQEALKSARKENILMRAKGKELETLRRRCAQLESTVHQQRQPDGLAAKCAELAAQLEAKQRENASLSATLRKREASIEQEQKKNASLTTLLREKDVFLSSQSRELKEELQARIFTLEAAVQEAQQATATLEGRLRDSEGERNAWAAKYESLRDSIPERDISTQPAVQLLPPPHHQAFTTSQEAREHSSVPATHPISSHESLPYPSSTQEPVVCPKSSKKCLAYPSFSQQSVVNPSISHESEVYSSNSQKPCVCSSSNQEPQGCPNTIDEPHTQSVCNQESHAYSSSVHKSPGCPNTSQETHVYLGNSQEHISKQNTDFTTTTTTTTTSSTNSTSTEHPAINSHSHSKALDTTSWHPDSTSATSKQWIKEKKPSGSLKESREEGDDTEARTECQDLQSVHVSSPSTCHTCEDQKSESKKELQCLLEKIVGLETLVTTRESELQEEKKKAMVAANEFLEKQRRYESNVRLLTRKLKEHMKGRKAAEKEVTSQAEEQQRLMNEERQRYETLRARCLELEGVRGGLEGQVSVLEGEVGEVRAALASSQQDSLTYHSSILHLQKEVGRLQEICKASDGLRAAVSGLEQKLEEREKLSSMLEGDLVAAKEEAKEGRERCTSLASALELLKKEKERFGRELKSTSDQLDKAQQDMKIQKDQNKCLEEDLTQFQKERDNLAQNLSAANAKRDQLALEVSHLQEERQSNDGWLEATRGQLQDSQRKVSALEHQLKVLQGDLEVSQEEARQVREQQVIKERSQAERVALLEEHLGASRKEAESLAAQFNQAKQERVSYQSQATQLRTALHSALAQLKSHESEREARAAQVLTLTSEVDVIPSPRPLDIASLTQLIEKTSLSPNPTPPPLTSLESCLSSLKAEVQVLQSRLQTSSSAESEIQGLSVKGSGAPNGASEIPVAPDNPAAAAEIVL